MATKPKMTLQTYIEAYRKYVGYYNEMATGVDFELLKNIDILDCSKITKTEKDEIEKFSNNIKKFDEDILRDREAYKAAYDFKEDKKFEICQNIVNYVYVQYHMVNGFTVFYEGILKFIKKKYNLRSDIFKYNQFKLGVILKDIYVSNIELLQNFIEFLNKVILNNMITTSTVIKINEINDSDHEVQQMIHNIAKNFLIKYNHEHILNVYDPKYEYNIREFFNKIIEPLGSKIDKSLSKILKNKYYALFKIKFKMRLYTNKTIKFFHESTFQIDLFQKEYQNLFKLYPYQIDNGNRALFEEFLYTNASLINLFYTNIDIKPFKDVNLLTIGTSMDVGFFNNYGLIYTEILPFIIDEIKFYTTVQAYVTTNAASFDTIKLTDITNASKTKDYLYIEYILESLNFVKEIFIGIMNVLYTIRSKNQNLPNDPTINFLNTLIKNIPFIFDMLKFLTFEMYEIIIFQENKTLNFDLIKNFKYFSYYDEPSNKYVEIINSQDYYNKVIDTINMTKQQQGLTQDYIIFLINGYDIKTGQPTIPAEPTYYGVVGFYYIMLNLNKFYNILIENIDNFKNDSVSFKYRGKTYNFQGFLYKYKIKYIGKNSTTANNLIDELELKYIQYNTPSIQTKTQTTQTTQTKKPTTSSALVASKLSKSSPTLTLSDSSSSSLSTLGTQILSASAISKPAKKPDTQQLNSSRVSFSLPNKTVGDSQDLNDDDLKAKLYYLHQKLGLLSQRLDQYKNSDISQSYFTRLHKISDYRTFKTQTDREPQDFIARIKLKNIGGKQNIGKYKYITEDSLGKVANNNKARELANNYNQLTDKMIETEKKIGGIQKLALNELNKSESGYIRMRGGEQQTLNYNNLIKQYQLMAIKQNNIINEIKNIKNRNY